MSLGLIVTGRVGNLESTERLTDTLLALVFSGDMLKLIQI